MKRLNQIILLVFVICLSFFTEIVKAVPDKFGNGGAVWSCETQNADIMDLMLIDIDEARRELKLNVPETTMNHIPYLQEKKEWIKKNLSFQFVLMPHIEYVEQNINWIEGEMILVPDIKNVSKPSPALCKGGRWEARTVVNFGDDGRVLAAKELFDSPFLTEMERTALYLHEGVYSYMRTEYGDQDSLRSRKIVGYIMSDKADAVKIENINKILSITNPNPTPAPQPQVSGYICGIRPGTFRPLYIAEKKTEAEARTATLKSCVDGEKIGFPFPFDIPGAPPGFPGFPGGDGGGGVGGGFGPERDCKDTRVTCEAFSSSSQKYTCEIKDGFGNERVYVGTGRTMLEAQKKAGDKCVAGGSGDSTCYDSRDMDCSGN
jgi:hypothetical protein